MRIAFIFFAEAYQTYHGAAVAFELMRRPGVSVDIFHNMPDAGRHFARIAEAHDLVDVRSQPLNRSLWTRFVQGLRVFGWEKTSILQQNEEMLSRYNAVISMEDGASVLFNKLPDEQRPIRILIMHGAGDRDVPSSKNRIFFDLILTLGDKMSAKLVDLGHARLGHISAPGYIKFESSRLFRKRASDLFENNRPIVLYNPHKDRKLGSWNYFIDSILSDFLNQQEFNLIVAPHVKMFLRKSSRTRAKWRTRSTKNIIIDPGSDLSVDNSYTEVADIYVGDVSSQVYEFLERPRPCVFLNAKGIDWHEDWNFLFWQLGDVVDNPKDLMDAIRAAPSRHHLYLQKQQEFAARSLGDTSPGAAKRAADVIVQYMRDGKVIR